MYISYIDKQPSHLHIKRKIGPVYGYCNDVMIHVSLPSAWYLSVAAVETIENDALTRHRHDTEPQMFKAASHPRNQPHQLAMLYHEITIGIKSIDRIIDCLCLLRDWLKSAWLPYSPITAILFILLYLSESRLLKKRRRFSYLFSYCLV